MLSCLRDSFILLRKNDPLRLAGATAFFSTFALPPIVFILAQGFGLFVGPRRMGRELIEKVSLTLGADGAEQVKEVIRSILGFNDSWQVIIPGFIFLVFVATTLFTVIRHSLDQIWQISVNEKPGVFFAVLNRTRSLGVIILAGLLLLTDIFLESLEVIAGNYVDAVWSQGSMYLKSFMAKIGSVFIVTAWFILLFRFLADGQPKWKACIWGGLLTGILFTAGRLLLRVLFDNSNIGKLYGSSGSFVLVLLFVFYSSFILYYGACFIAVYSAKKGWPVTPGKKAFGFRVQQVKKPVV